MSDSPLDILCEDGPVIAVNKPAGLIVQGAPSGVVSLVDLVKQYLKEKYAKPGNVYLGIVQRLDRPVSGVVVFSRNSKCAARLTEQFRERLVQKTYLAVLDGVPEPSEGTLTDWILRDEQQQGPVQIVSAETPAARQAVLSYRVLEQRAGRALVQIDLGTGRMHQIRVQFAHRGWPILGDVKYGAPRPFPGADVQDPRTRPIALHAASLTFKHPIRYEELTISAPVPRTWRALGFERSLPAAISAR
jgi:23S rRNA pseudouridine1911/1915/1917 synthase